MDPETITAQVYIDSFVREVHLYQQGVIYATWRISFIRLGTLKSKMFFKTTVIYAVCVWSCPLCQDLIGAANQIVDCKTSLSTHC